MHVTRDFARLDLCLLIGDAFIHLCAHRRHDNGGSLAAVAGAAKAKAKATSIISTKKREWCSALSDEVHADRSRRLRSVDINHVSKLSEFFFQGWGAKRNQMLIQFAQKCVSN